MPIKTVTNIDFSEAPNNINTHGSNATKANCVSE